MKLATFKGGIHPAEGKELSKDKPMKKLIPGKELVYPMSQHIGAPAVPVVKVGDTVLVGQKIADAGGFVSAPVVASVSGTVKKIEPRVLANGNTASCIVIENDGQYTKAPGVGEKKDYKKLSKKEIREIIKEAGIVGLGGAGFPTNVKLTPKDDSKIDYVIINGAECEPYLTSDYRMLLEQPERVVEGLKIELQLFEHAKGIIAIENNKPDAIEKLEQLVSQESRISVCPLMTKYPQGGERFLIYATTGRKINSSMLPADAGCVVSNVDTAAAIQMAVSESTPLMRRIITVTGNAIKEPQNFIVPTGINYQELLDAAGGLTCEPEKIINGGPMMGKAMFSLNVPVTKNSTAILALTKDEVSAMEPSACIRCGRCVSACPEHIVPQMLYEAATNGDAEKFEKLNGMECCECGSCTFVCPAKRNLTQAFAQMRATVMANRKKK